MSIRLGLLAVALLAFVTSVGGASPPGRPGTPPGGDLVLSGPAEVVVSGEMGTRAVPTPGAHGPDIWIDAPGTLIFEPGARLRAADGNDGADALQLGQATGGPGGHGGNIFIHAKTIVANGAVLRLGAGGHGGNARAQGAPSAIAQGGRGGDGGRLIVEGLLIGSFQVQGGAAGDGGNATAVGAEGPVCSPEVPPTTTQHGDRGLPDGGPGESVNVTGAQGNCGPVNGKGTRGGDAVAMGGAGGDATGNPGGRGGDATANGGRGGHGLDACYASELDAVGARKKGILEAGDGGDGGTPWAYGGHGGNGTRGGNGGNALATAVAGDGGNATFPIMEGRFGEVIDKDHGEGAAVGGNGGSGYVGGNGGIGHSSYSGGQSGHSCLLKRAVGAPGLPFLLVAVGISIAWRARGSQGRRRDARRSGSIPDR